MDSEARNFKGSVLLSSALDSGPCSCPPTLLQSLPHSPTRGLTLSSRPVSVAGQRTCLHTPSSLSEGTQGQLGSRAASLAILMHLYPLQSPWQHKAAGGTAQETGCLETVLRMGGARPETAPSPLSEGEVKRGEPGKRDGPPAGVGSPASIPLLAT